MAQGGISHSEGCLGHVSSLGEHPCCGINPYRAEVLLKSLTGLSLYTPAKIWPRATAFPCEDVKVQCFLVVFPKVGERTIGKMIASSVVLNRERFVITRKEVNREKFSDLGLIPKVSGGFRNGRIPEPSHESFFVGPHGPNHSEAGSVLPFNELVKLWMEVN